MEILVKILCMCLFSNAFQENGFQQGKVSPSHALKQARHHVKSNSRLYESMDPKSNRCDAAHHKY